MPTIETLGENFDNWDMLLALLHNSFSYMNDRIDPPSSLHFLDQVTLEKKAVEETVFAAYENRKLIGCCFLKDMGLKNYLGKMAIDPDLQRRGVGEALLKAAIGASRNAGKTLLELETRIELTEVHAFFRRFGFVQTSESAHEGYCRPTSITMQLEL